MSTTNGRGDPYTTGPIEDPVARGKAPDAGDTRARKIAARWAKATPGSWETARFDNDGGDTQYQVQAPDAGEDGGDRDGSGLAVVAGTCELEHDAGLVLRARWDAEAIAAAPDDVRWLLAERERLTRERDEARAEVERLTHEVKSAREQMREMERDFREELKDAYAEGKRRGEDDVYGGGGGY